MRLIFNSFYKFGLQLSQPFPLKRKRKSLRRTSKLLTHNDKKIEYSPWQAFQLTRLHSFNSFEQTVDICLQMGVNPKHGDHMIRGSAFMPSGLGKDIRIAVLCPPQLQDELKEVVDVFFDENVLKDIKNGRVNFDTLFTIPSLINTLKPHGKLLGPKGLMPNIKVGTLVEEEKLLHAIKQAKFGKATFKVDSGKNIHTQLGKVSFTDDQLLANLRALMFALQEKKPQKLKGKYLKGAFIKSTMGPRWKLKVEDIDPKNQRSIWALLKND